MTTNIIYKEATKKEEFESLKELALQVFDQEVKELVDDLFYKSPKRKENVYLYAYDTEAKKSDCNVSNKYADFVKILFPCMNSHFYINY